MNFLWKVNCVWSKFFSNFKDFFHFFAYLNLQVTEKLPEMSVFCPEKGSIRESKAKISIFGDKNIPRWPENDPAGFLRR